MITSIQGIKYIIDEEGNIGYEYYCPANVPTIGVGCVTAYIDDSVRRTLKKIPLSKVSLVGKIRPVVDEDGLVMVATDEEILYLFRTRLVEFENAVNKYIRIKLEQHQFDALVSFCFNVGVSNFAKSTLCKCINEKADSNIIVKWFAVWNKSKGKVLPVLVKRRKREADLFLYGKYEL